MLGRGSFGTVVRGVFHGSDVAVKVVQYARDKEKDVDAFAMEVAMMTKLHQCVGSASPSWRPLPHPSSSPYPRTHTLPLASLPRTHAPLSVGDLPAHSPNIVMILGVAVSTARCRLKIVCELMSCGSLYGVIHSNAWDVERPMLLRLALDGSKGLAFLHGRSPPWCTAT